MRCYFLSLPKQLLWVFLHRWKQRVIKGFCEIEKKHIIAFQLIDELFIFLISFLLGFQGFTWFDAMPWGSNFLFSAKFSFFMNVLVGLFSEKPKRSIFQLQKSSVEIAILILCVLIVSPREQQYKMKV